MGRAELSKLREDSLGSTVNADTIAVETPDRNFSWNEQHGYLISVLSSYTSKRSGIGPRAQFDRPQAKLEAQAGPRPSGQMQVLPCWLSIEVEN